MKVSFHEDSKMKPIYGLFCIHSDGYTYSVSNVLCHNNANMFAFEKKSDAEDYLRAHGKKIAHLNDCQVEDISIKEIDLY
jgi:hypothetical protein